MRSFVLSFRFSLLVASFACPAGDADDTGDEDRRDANDNESPDDDNSKHCFGSCFDRITDVLEDGCAVLIADTRFVVVHSGAILAVVILPVRGVVV